MVDIFQYSYQSHCVERFLLSLKSSRTSLNRSRQGSPASRHTTRGSQLFMRDLREVTQVDRFPFGRKGREGEQAAPAIEASSNNAISAFL